MQTPIIKRWLSRVSLIAVIAIMLMGCAEVQEGYDDDDVGSPSQGAPLEGGAEEIEDFEEDNE
jgi:hypothetical protein